MKKNFLLIFVLVISSTSYLKAQSISFVSPTMNEEISGGNSKTLIPLTLTYNSVKDNQYPSSIRVEYIKLYTETGEYYDNIGNGIPAGTNEMPEQWNLAPGTYHWILEQYEKYAVGGIIASCSTEVYFYVKHTIKVENNIGGVVKIDFHSKSSGSTTLKFVNKSVHIEAPNQEVNGSYYVWDYYGSDPSKWKIKKLGENEVDLSNNKFHSYYVESDANKAVLKSYLKYDETPSAAPTNLQISESQDEHPVLNWTANTEPDLEEYNIYRKGGYPFIDWAVIGTTTSNTYEDLELTTTYRHGEDYFYKITAVDVNDNESDYSNTVEAEARLEKQNIKEELESKPKNYALNSNYPNPFNPTTNISYQLPKASNVTLKVYDMLGKEVAELVNENKSAGIYNVILMQKIYQVVYIFIKYKLESLLKYKKCC